MINARDAVDILSALIERELTILHNEEAAPHHGADQSGELIARKRVTIPVLRELRTKLEDLAPELGG